MEYEGQVWTWRGQSGCCVQADDGDWEQGCRSRGGKWTDWDVFQRQCYQDLPKYWMWVEMGIREPQQALGGNTMGRVWWKLFQVWRLTYYTESAAKGPIVFILLWNNVLETQHSFAWPVQNLTLALSIHKPNRASGVLYLVRSSNVFIWSWLGIIRQFHVAT